MIIVAYDVAYADNRHDLIQVVNRMIKTGWQPQGAIHTQAEDPVYPGYGFYQTLVRVRHLGEIHDDGKIEWLDKEIR